MDYDKKHGNLSNNLLSPQKLAEYLGVSVGTIYGWRFQRLIPYVKVGRLVKFEPEKIKIWLDQKRVEPFK